MSLKKCEYCLKFLYEHTRHLDRIRVGYQKRCFRIPCFLPLRRFQVLLKSYGRLRWIKCLRHLKLKCTWKRLLEESVISPRT